MKNVFNILGEDVCQVCTIIMVKNISKEPS